MQTQSAQTHKAIEMLGYTPKEAAVYVAVLGMGKTLVSAIAQKVNMPLASVQVIVKKLLKDGLVHGTKDGTRYTHITAVNPVRLLDRVQAHEAEMRRALPQLQALRKQVPQRISEPSLEVYVGDARLQAVYDDMLETKQRVFCVMPNDALLTTVTQSPGWDVFTAARVRNFLPLHCVVPETKAGEQFAQKSSAHHMQVRLSSQSMQTIDSLICMYGTKVASITMHAGEVSATVIDDASVYGTHIALFTELWDSGHLAGESKTRGGLSALRVFSDASPNPILITNESIEIEYVNGAWEKLFGYSLFEVQGRNPSTLQSGKTPRHVYKHMWAALTKHTLFQSDEIIDKKKDGTLFRFLTSIYSVRVHGHVYYVQILNELTDRDYAHHAQRTMKRALSAKTAKKKTLPRSRQH